MTGLEFALRLIPAFFAGAPLYAMVGHGGASADPGILALAGLAPPTPSAPYV
jgi:hypothetical protein